MSSGASAGSTARQLRADGLIRRGGLIALLLAALLLPHVSSNGFEYPAVSDGWVLLVFCGLVLLPFLDAGALRRLYLLDLIALLSFVVALGLERPGTSWPVLLAYPPMLYLGWRMIALSRPSHTRPRDGGSLHLLIGRRWLVVGILVLGAVHIWWALTGTANVDVARAGVVGAQKLLHGQALYSAPARGSVDLHLDTYGPLDYVAYLPFVALAHGYTAARLTTVFVDLLTGALLFALGRQVRNVTAGIVLAYVWLAFPLGLYGDALGLNDSLVAASLVATVLVARSPARRGAMAAVAGWVKLSPLALVPLLAGHRSGRSRSARRELLEFSLAFALLSGLVLVPVLVHGGLATFISRTFGFQAGRSPEDSLWAALQNGSVSHAAWLAKASRIAHGVLVAATGAFVLLFFRAPRRQDVVGLAATSAAILLALELSMSYYSYSYTLWFAPLVMVPVVLAHLSEATAAGEGEGEGDREAHPHDALESTSEARPAALRTAPAYSLSRG